MKRIVIKNDLLEFRGIIMFDCTLAEAAKWCLKNEAKGRPEGLKDLWRETAKEKKNRSAGITYSHQGDFIIWVSENPFTTKRGKTLLAHEAAHAALKVMKHWSFDPLDRTGDEMMAVLVGYITKQVFQR